MARLPRFPSLTAQRKLRGAIQIVSDRGIVVAKKWPRKRPEKPTPAAQELRTLFGQMAKSTKDVTWWDYQASIMNSVGIPLVPRDIISLAMVGRWVEWEYNGIGDEIMPDVQLILGQLGLIPGSIILCTNEGYVLLEPPTEVSWLRYDPDLVAATWFTGSPTGIDELTGDVLAGPGSGSQVATLSNSGVVPGTYTTPDLTIDSAGRILSAASNPSSPGITALTGDAVAGPGSGSQTLTLVPSGVTPGTYTAPNISVDAKGRLTAAANSGIVSGINQLTGDATAGPGSGSQAITLAPSGVAAGTYTAPNITVDSKGRLTAAANSGIVSGINQITGDATAGPGTGSQALTLANSGVTPGSYTAANITVDSKGRLSAASNSGLVSGINQITGDATAGPGTGSQALTLAASGVTPGTYDAATITVDTKGRLTAAASGSALTTGLQGHPGIRTGIFYPPVGIQSTTTPAAQANRLFARAFYIPNACTLQSFNLEVLSITGTPDVEFGLYTNNNGVPGTLIQDFGSLHLTSTGNKAITSIGLVLSPGWYFATGAWSAQISIRGQTVPDQYLANLLGMDTAINSGSASPVYGAWTFVANSLPGSFPTVVYGGNIAPRFVLGF